MTSAMVADLVAEAIQGFPLELRPADLEASLGKYLDRLFQTNRNVNLVSRRDTPKHVVRFTRECLALAHLLHKDRDRLALQRQPRLLDLGSGGGFPGVILKLALPDVEVHLVEGTRKKANFLEEVDVALNLLQLEVLWSRAEDLSDARRPTHRADFLNHFDWVTGKALGTIQDSTRLAAPFLAPEGVHWTFKGAACQAELRAASGFFRQRGFALHRLERLPGDGESYAVGIRRLPRA